MISLVNAVELAYWQETTIKVVVILGVIPAGALILGYVFLMKMMSFMQSRLGPMEAGPYGTLQLIADGLKFLQKEDIFPEKADRWVFALAPLVVLISTFLLFVVVPVGPDLIVEDLDTGIVFASAFPGSDAFADELRRRSHGGGPKIAVLGVPDRYIPHAKPDVILAQLGLDAAGIANTVRDLRA